VQLKSFLRSEIASLISSQIHHIDHEVDQLGNGVPPSSYAIGINSSSDWQILGPPHKRRYLSYTPSTSLSQRLLSHTVESDAVSAELLLDAVRSSLFQSTAFMRYLKLLTNLHPIGYKNEMRRFRPGLDYTVAHYGAMTKVPRLDATLCFVNDKSSPSAPAIKPTSKQPASNDDEEEEDEEEEFPLTAAELWASGDVGGFECYIEADSKNTAEAAEVYQTKSKGKDKEGDAEEDDTKLLSVSAGNNVLSLVMRDEDVMRFIKYVSFNAPGSRWDISAEYELDLKDEDADSDSDSQSDN
jgi:prolyl 3-hydroxylase /prolyl 3,4-dihydroxylase